MFVKYCCVLLSTGKPCWLYIEINIILSLRIEQISVSLINSRFELYSFQIKRDLVYRNGETDNCNDEQEFEFKLNS